MAIPNRKAFFAEEKSKLKYIRRAHVEREMNMQDENNAEDKMVEHVLYEFSLQQK